MSAADCVFCRIVAGEIACLKVFEDADTLAFLDIGPLAEGHTLVIPRQHYERIEQMPPDLLGRIMSPIPRLVRAVMAATGTDACNVLANTGAAAGQVVMHVHIHIIPRRSGDGLGYRWPAGKYPPGRGEEVARQIGLAL